MNVRASLRRGVGVAGLIAGPGAWAVSTQLNYALVPIACRYTTLIVGLPAAALICLAAAGGLLSWPAWHRSGAPRSGDAGMTAEIFTEEDGRTHKFIAALGAVSATLFALVIVMQGTSALVLDGCMR